MAEIPNFAGGLKPIPKDWLPASGKIFKVKRLTDGVECDAELMLPTWFGTPDRKMRFEMNVVRVRHAPTDAIILWVDDEMTRPIRTILHTEAYWGRPVYKAKDRSGYIILPIPAGDAHPASDIIIPVIRSRWIPQAKQAMEILKSWDTHVLEHSVDFQQMGDL